MIFPPIPEDGRVLFFARDRPEFGFLSHFHPSPIELDGEVWPTVEHYYQTQKSLDPRYQRTIRACETPGRAKQLATGPEAVGKRAKNSWFIAHKAEPRADWMQINREVMRKADRAKYAQHPDLAARLLACGGAEIIEESPRTTCFGAPDATALGRTGPAVS